MYESDEVFDTSRRSEHPVSGDPEPERYEAVSSSPDPGSRRSPILYDVRACRIGDLNDLRRLRAVEILNQPDAFLRPFSPFRAGMRATLRWPRSRRRVLVARTDEGVVGCAALQPIRPDHRWRLVALGTATGVHDPRPVLEELLNYGVLLAGLNGVKRLYARVPTTSDAVPALRAIGFAPYASEAVMVATSIGPRKMPAALRSQEASDTWAIHQLYNAAVPKQVQYAEALTSHHWDIGKTRAAEAVDVAGWVVEEGHHVVGYARITSRGETTSLDFIVHPERLDVLDDLVDGALAQLSNRAVSRIYCAVRDYQGEIRSPLSARGFVPLHDQEHHVKYTTVNVRQPAFETVPLRADVRERVPKRVPTFLQGQSGDESAR